MKIFIKINRTTFNNNNNAIPIERNHYIFIPAIDIDSVIKFDKRVYPQAYLEQCNYKLVLNLLDFEPEKVSIETENNDNNNTRTHNIKYKNGGFYLTINNLRGYFNFNNNLGTLTMLFDDINQQNK